MQLGKLFLVIIFYFISVEAFTQVLTDYYFRDNFLYKLTQQEYDSITDKNELFELIKSKEVYDNDRIRTFSKNHFPFRKEPGHYVFLQKDWRKKFDKDEVGNVYLSFSNAPNFRIKVINPEFKTYIQLTDTSNQFITDAKFSPEQPRYDSLFHGYDITNITNEEMKITVGDYTFDYKFHKYDQKQSYNFRYSNYGSSSTSNGGYIDTPFNYYTCGDTVYFQASLLRNDKPLKKKLHFQVFETYSKKVERVKGNKIEPISPGIYKGHFIVDSLLCIKREESLSIQLSYYGLFKRHAIRKKITVSNQKRDAEYKIESNNGVDTCSILLLAKPFRENDNIETPFSCSFNTERIYIYGDSNSLLLPLNKQPVIGKMFNNEATIQPPKSIQLKNSVVEYKMSCDFEAKSGALSNITKKFLYDSRNNQIDFEPYSSSSSAPTFTRVFLDSSFFTVSLNNSKNTPYLLCLKKNQTWEAEFYNSRDTVLQLSVQDGDSLIVDLCSYEKYEQYCETKKYVIANNKIVKAEPVVKNTKPKNLKEEIDQRNREQSTRIERSKIEIYDDGFYSVSGYYYPSNRKEVYLKNKNNKLGIKTFTEDDKVSQLKSNDKGHENSIIFDHVEFFTIAGRGMLAFQYNDSLNPKYILLSSVDDSVKLKPDEIIIHDLKAGTYNLTLVLPDTTIVSSKIKVEADFLTIINEKQWQQYLDTNGQNKQLFSSFKYADLGYHEIDNQIFNRNRFGEIENRVESFKTERVKRNVFKYDFFPPNNTILTLGFIRPLLTGDDNSRMGFYAGVKLPVLQTKSLFVPSTFKDKFQSSLTLNLDYNQFELQSNYQRLGIQNYQFGLGSYFYIKKGKGIYKKIAIPIQFNVSAGLTIRNSRLAQKNASVENTFNLGGYARLILHYNLYSVWKELSNFGIHLGTELNYVPNTTSIDMTEFNSSLMPLLKFGIDFRFYKYIPSIHSHVRMPDRKFKKKKYK